MEFDQLSRIRLLEPSKADSSIKLQDGCKDFVQSMQQLAKENHEIVEILKQKSIVLERQKKKSLGMRHAVQVEKQSRDSRAQKIQIITEEKLNQLKRLNQQYESLQRIHQEQLALIEFLGSR